MVTHIFLFGLQKLLIAKICFFPIAITFAKIHLYKEAPHLQHSSII